MTNHNYKIFISYRHDDTADKAEHLLSLLEASGYKGLVSFDRENLDGRFDLEIMRRLDACTDFIAIIGAYTLANIKKEEALWYQRLATCTVEDFPTLEAAFIAEKCERRKDNGEEIREEDKRIDFVRLEIARAIANGKNVIPVVPVDSDIFNFDKLELPDDIKLFNKYQAEKYQDSKNFLFKDILPKVKKRLKTHLYKYRMLQVGLIVLITVFVFAGIFLCQKWRTEKNTFESLRSMSDYENFQNQTWFYGKQCADSIKEFGLLRGTGNVPINDAIARKSNDSIRVDWDQDCSLEQLRVLRKIINNMILVPKGTFLMGTTREEGLENPLHREKIENDFYMAKFELTQREWNVVMNDSVTGSDKLPMANISWDDCMNFINRLNHLTRLVFSLPTEAQWEYAAGYPNNNSQNNGYLDKAKMRYAGSDNADDVAVYATNKPMEVGIKKPCEREIYDLSGNVAEWCAYEDANKRKKHIRGGSFQSTVDEVTVTYVDSATGSEGSTAIGMRLVLIR